MKQGTLGAEYALLSGIIACAFVVSASVYGPDLTRVVNDRICDVSSDCAVSFMDAGEPIAADRLVLSELITAKAATMRVRAKDRPRSRVVKPVAENPAHLAALSTGSLAINAAER